MFKKLLQFKFPDVVIFPDISIVKGDNLELIVYIWLDKVVILLLLLYIELLIETILLLFP